MALLPIMPSALHSLLLQYFQTLTASQFWLLLLAFGAFFGLLGFLLAWLLKVVATSKLKQEIILNQQFAEKQQQHWHNLNQELQGQFASLSQHALAANSQQFLHLAKESFASERAHQTQQNQLAQQALNHLVSPIKTALEKTDAQLRAIEKERMSDLGSLRQQLTLLAKSQGDLQTETRNLVNALRRPQVRGMWGEMTLKRLAELSGMVEFCDFYQQENISTENGNLRPDMVVRMPDNRCLIVDAKTPLDAYLQAHEAKTDSARRDFLQRHAQALRQRVRELAQKQYWQQFANTPDFVILFVPGEQFLSAALEVDADILEYALGRQVILASPNSLVALLRAVAFGWRQQSVAENAEKIQALGEDLYSRIATFAEHINKMGAALERTTDSYNKAVGSLERNVLSAARRFVELGIEERKELPNATAIETQVRASKPVE